MEGNKRITKGGKVEYVCQECQDEVVVVRYDRNDRSTDQG